MENPLADFLEKFRPYYDAMYSFEKFAGLNGHVRQVWNAEKTRIQGVLVFRDIDVPGVFEIHSFALKAALKNMTVHRLLHLIIPPYYGTYNDPLCFTDIPRHIATARILRKLGIHEGPENIFIWRREDVLLRIPKYQENELVLSLFR